MGGTENSVHQDQGLGTAFWRNLHSSSIPRAKLWKTNVGEMAGYSGSCPNCIFLLFSQIAPNLGL